MEALQRLRHMELAQLAALLKEESSVANADFLQSFVQDVPFSHCANRTADAVLFEAAGQMKEKGIQARFDVSLPEDPNLDSSVLMSLMTNLLDNAMRAAQDCAPANRFVSLEMFVRKGSLVCICENSVENDIRIIKGKSTKSGAGHGYGLQILEDLCQTHQGAFSWEIKEGTCRAMAVLAVGYKS